MAEMKKETGELGMLGGKSTVIHLLRPKGSGVFPPHYNKEEMETRRITLCGKWVTPIVDGTFFPLTFGCGLCFPNMRAYTSGPTSEGMVTFHTFQIGLLDGI